MTKQNLTDPLAMAMAMAMAVPRADVAVGESFFEYERART